MKRLNALFVIIAMAVFVAADDGSAAHVDANTESGVAAVCTFGPGVSLLGTDGKIYVMGNPLQAKGRWECVTVEWPVPISEIVEWMPGNEGFGPGLIQTSSGDWWYCNAEDDGRGYKNPEWTKLTLEEIVASMKPRERCE